MVISQCSDFCEVDTFLLRRRNVSSTKKICFFNEEDTFRQLRRYVSPTKKIRFFLSADSHIVVILGEPLFKDNLGAKYRVIVFP